MDKNKVADKLLERRVILAEGMLDDELYNKIRLSLISLEEQSTKEIKIYFHSPGGNAGMGLLINDMLDMMQSPVTAVVHVAASAALTIVQSCKKRLITKSGRVLIHSSRLDKFSQIVCDELWEERMEELRRFLRLIKKRKEEIFTKRTGHSIEEINQWMKRGDLFEHWFFAEDAKEAGLVDDIVADNYHLLGKEDKPKPKAP